MTLAGLAALLDRGPWRRIVGVALVLGALALGLRWAGRRYIETLGEPRAHDLEDYFIPAADSILRGGSPFDVWGYVHSPAAAYLLAAVEWMGGDPKQVWMFTIPIVALAVCVVWSVVVTRGRPLWVFGLVLGFSTVTLFTSRQLARQFFMGQYDLLLLLLLGLGLLLHQRKRHGAAGYLLAAPAALKLWPAVFLIVLLNRSFRTPRHLVGVAAAAVTAVALCLPFGGLQGVITMLVNAAGFSSQGLIAYSGFGIGKALFLTDGEVVPLVISPAAAAVTAVVVTGAALVLLGLVVWKSRNATWSLCVVMALALLVIPVSHLSYQLFAMPLLWLTFATVLASPLQWRIWPLMLIGSAWWVKIALHAPDQAPGERVGTLTPSSFIVQAALSFLHSAVGAICAVTQSDPVAPATPVLGLEHAPDEAESRPRRHP